MIVGDWQAVGHVGSPLAVRGGAWLNANTAILTPVHCSMCEHL